MTGPDHPWAGRDHAQLAVLVRELLLAGHLVDRSGMPQLIAELGRDGMRDVAIAEWMAASPVYTDRTRRLLGIEGSTVEAIFKAMQFDIGAPPEFMDFRFEVTDDDHGAFHLDHCGALMDVEPMGEDYVVTMCHHIEDPTFDATATATNPRARVRPVHRPPRAPVDRHPHCAWTVTVDPDAEPLPVPAGSEDLSRSRLAAVPLSDGDPSLPDHDGWRDYRRPLDPDLAMERFSSRMLSALADEVALQGQLLARAFLVALADRVAPADLARIGVAQAAGVAGLTTKRLAAALGAPATLGGLAEVLTVHPLLLPRAVVPLRLERAGDGLAVSLDPSAIDADGDGLTWTGLLLDDCGDEILDAAAVCLVPTAVVTATGRGRWTVTDTGSARTQPDSVTLTEFSTGAAFTFGSPTRAGRS